MNNTAVNGTLKVEVEFTKIYENQPLFSDVDLCLRNQGFTFFDFGKLNRDYRRRGPLISQPHSGQLIWTDAFYAWLDAHEYYWLSEHIPYAVVSIGIVFILLNIVSIILYKLIEEPMNHYIRKSSLLEKKVKPVVNS